MSEIRKWLETIGLGQYADAFEANDIDIDLLAQVDDQLLKDFGISSAGHRLRIRNAITKLGAHIQSETADGRLMSAGAASAERRQVTVMFSDLVGSTALSTRMDPEDLREVISAYQDSVAVTVGRFGGFVARYIGDGVLAYFGYPHAHEHDAERAVRAGLELVKETPKLKTAAGGPLQVRVGIATGLVVVGDLIGGGSVQEHEVVGETPNLAARLQAAAEPGQVVISDTTRRLVGGLFEYSDLGRLALKGLAEHQAWRVTGAGAIESRFEARHEHRLAPLIGREEELGLLLHRWRYAQRGEGRVVLMTGEAGIGKSRLTSALLERLGDARYTLLRYFCSPHHSDSSLYPIIRHLSHAAGFARLDTPDQKLAKLTALVRGAGGGSDETLAPIADLLGLAAPGTNRFASMDPRKRKEMTLAALIVMLQSLAAREPALMIFEDLQWLDPSTLDLLTLMVDAVAAMPVLFLMTARPEFSPSWPGHAHATTISLARLGQREVLSLIDNVTSGKALPEDVSRQIAARTDGVPLFVEELTKTILESGLLRLSEDRYMLEGSLPPLAIPSTLHDSLMARLDRLSSVREVVQVGGAIGREFSFELLAAVTELPQVRLENALAELVHAELVFARGSPPHAVYSFKHALVRDAAYNSLLRSKRQQIHARIAPLLEERFPDTEPEVVAQHYSAAGLASASIPHWLKAGQNAARRSAQEEAVRHLTKGLAQVAILPDGIDRARQELALQTTLGATLMTAKGWASAEARNAYDRARELSRDVGSTLQVFQTLWGSWMFEWSGGNVRAARALEGELSEIARREGDVVMSIEAHHAGWTTGLIMGELRKCIEHVEAGLASYRPEEHGTLGSSYGGHDPGVCAHGVAAVAWWLRGYSDRASRERDAAVALTRQIPHLPSISHALLFCTEMERMRRNMAAVRDHAERLLSVAEDKGQMMFVAMARFHLAGVELCEGRSGALEEMRRAFMSIREMGSGGGVLSAWSLVTFADSLVRVGQIEESAHAVATATTLARQSADQFFLQSEILRLNGEVALLRDRAGGASEAENWFKRASTESRLREARSLELRAALSLAQLWRDQHRRTEAYDLLAPIYDWFTEGHDLPDLM
ncbi:MAG TPA: adenylate/guanylate cyclase domain-containing protein, partial [Casimicrobiaceae bacterium]|nr:adenylate/guanylate cyclase domain-containing protein [Casimicrobiaceae bacterium]